MGMNRRCHPFSRRRLRRGAVVSLWATLFLVSTGCSDKAKPPDSATAQVEEPVLVVEPLTKELAEYLEHILLGPDPEQIPSAVQDIFGSVGDTPVSWPPALLPILKRLGDGKSYAIAVSDCDKILARPLSSFPNPAEAAWTRALALRLRGTARIYLRDGGRALADAQQAAATATDDKLLEGLTDIYAAHLNGTHKEPLLKLSQSTYLSTMRDSASLGSLRSIDRLLGSKTRRDKDEQIFWESLDSYFSYRRTYDPSAISLDPPSADYLDEVIEKYGEGPIASALARYGIGALPIRSIISGLPDRDLRRAFFVDSLLRRARKSYFNNLAYDFDLGPPDETVSDFFKDVRTIGEGYPATAYLVVAGTAPKKDPQIVGSSVPVMIREISPGDVAFFRCGPLSHVAIVSQVNRKAGTIDFIDSVFQFWQPTHNDCVSRWTLEKERAGIYTSRLPLADVADMIQAFMTIRNPH